MKTFMLCAVLLSGCASTGYVSEADLENRCKAEKPAMDLFECKLAARRSINNEIARKKAESEREDKIYYECQEWAQANSVSNRQMADLRLLCIKQTEYRQRKGN